VRTAAGGVGAIRLVTPRADACQSSCAFRVLTHPARYLLGLTATPYRRDKLDAVIGWHLGPTVARIDAKDLADRLVTPRVVKRMTGVRPRPYSDGYAALVSELVADEDRMYTAS